MFILYGTGNIKETFSLSFCYQSRYYRDNNRNDKEGNTFYYVMYDTDKYVRFKHFSSVVDFISSNF